VITDPPVPDKRNKRIVITTMTIAFAVTFFFLVGRGSTCERYERKMEGQTLMRNYIDSMRMESDKKKSKE